MMKETAGIAVLFPGIGYTCDKPLLYYSEKIARERGYEIRRVPYGNFPPGVKGDAAKMYQCFVSAREQAETILAGIDWTAYRDILFFSKSVGTAVALSYAVEHKIHTRQILYTPLEETFRFPTDPAGTIVFHGTADPWAKTEEIVRICEKMGFTLHLTENANHSLECGKARKDIKTIRKVMKTVEEFIWRGADHPLSK